MSDLKTKETNADVHKFIESIKEDKKREDALELLKIFKDATGEKPKMWGSSIIGFGKYHYKSTRSSQEGDWMLTGFSPRKQALTLYIMPGFDDYQALLKNLGKYKRSTGSCMYVKKLEDVDKKTLSRLIRESYQKMIQTHQTP